MAGPRAPEFSCAVVFLALAVSACGTREKAPSPAPSATPSTSLQLAAASSTPAAAKPTASAASAPAAWPKQLFQLRAGRHTLGAVGHKVDSFEALRREEVEIGGVALDLTEVPVSAYRSCVAANACTAPEAQGPRCNYARREHEGHPINCVSRNQAAAFCKWANGRLPSEQEWEAAARMVVAKDDGVDDGRCLFGRFSTKADTCLVLGTGSKLLPGWSDNVAEWVTGNFCRDARPQCQQHIVKGRSFRDTVSIGLFDRFFSPASDNTRARRSPEEVGFRCGYDRTQ